MHICSMNVNGSKSQGKYDRRYADNVCHSTLKSSVITECHGIQLTPWYNNADRIAETVRDAHRTVLRIRSVYVRRDKEIMVVNYYLELHIAFALDLLAVRI